MVTVRLSDGKEAMELEIYEDFWELRARDHSTILVFLTKIGIALSIESKTGEINQNERVQKRAVCLIWEFQHQSYEVGFHVTQLETLGRNILRL